MRTPRPLCHLLPALALAACAGTRPAPTPAPAPVAATPATTARTRALLEQIADRVIEANGAPLGSDSLLAPGFTAVRDGALVDRPPLLAGVGTGGSILVTGRAVTVHGDAASALVDYRWLSLAGRRPTEGRATLLFARRPGSGGEGWWVVHVHSSAVRD